MAGAIYKPGQGYWVRVITASFVGVLVLASALWAAQQTTRFDPPKVGYTVPIASVTGEIAPGATVELRDDGGLTVATAVVAADEPGAAGRTLRLEQVRVEPERDATEASRVVTEGFAASVPRASVMPIFAFPRVYLQGAVAGVILLAGAVVIYIYVGVRRRSVDFLINTDNEMKKVNWSTRREIIGSTWVVVIASVLISGVLFGIDLVFQAFFRAIHVLDI